MPEISIKDSVKQLMGDSPEPVRAFLVDKLDAVAKSLTNKYQLHVDQGGVLQRDLMLVLLGAREPGALAANLKTEARLDDATLNSILKDVNDQIFIPIRAQLHEEPAAAKPAAPQPPKPIAAPQPVAKPIPPPPANLPGVIMPKAPASPQARPTFASSFAPNAAPMSAPAAPKPLAEALKAAGVPLLEDHEEPHIDFKKLVAPPPAPAPRVMPTTMPMPPMAVPSVPPAPVVPLIERVMPIPAKSVVPSAPSAPAPQRPPVPQPPPVKSYAVDPYREQPDANEL